MNELTLPEDIRAEINRLRDSEISKMRLAETGRTKRNNDANQRQEELYAEVTK